jgi:hypothetical protein
MQVQLPVVKVCRKPALQWSAQVSPVVLLMQADVSTPQPIGKFLLHRDALQAGALPSSAGTTQRSTCGSPV